MTLSHFLHFCDYTPFEEDLDLNFNKLEFPSCKICLYQVWLKLVRCFILKDHFQYTNVKIVPHLVSHTLTLGAQGLVFRIVENKKKLKSDSHRNTSLENFWKQCWQISIVYITFEKDALRGSYINTRDESHLRDTWHSIQYLSIHSKPTIQYIIVARIAAVIIFFKDHILVTDRDVFYQTKT
jgi:hypothetical protein